MVREGGTKKVDNGGRVKRPNNFWAPFNMWWREKYEATGVRPSVAEMREWYAQNAHTVWPPGTVPALDDMLKIAKGLRSIEQVQTYFRSYRKGLKTRKDGEPSSPDAGGTRKRRQNSTVAQAADAATATTFIAALQNAARQYQQYQLQQALMVAGSVPEPQGGAVGTAHCAATAAGLPPGAPNWNFSREVAAAAALRTGACGGPSDESDDEDDGETHTPTCTAAAAGTVTTATTATATVTASATAAGIPDADRHMGEVQQATEAPFEDYGFSGAEAAGSSDDRMAEPHDLRGHSWMAVQQQQQQPHVLGHAPYPPPTMAHRRTVKAVHHASVGGAFPGGPAATRRSESSGGLGAGGAGAPVFNSVGGSTAGPSGLQTVTCRRTRIRTSAGGAMWQQEVLEQVEVGVVPAAGSMPPPPPMHAFGMQQQQPQQQPYLGMPLPEQEEMPMETDVAALMPPRKQLRAGDRAVLSLGGAEDFAAALLAGDGQEHGASRPEGLQAHMDSVPEHAGRRFVQSCGGFTAHTDSLRHKVPHHGGPSLMALSDGGATYGAQQAAAQCHPADLPSMTLPNQPGPATQTPRAPPSGFYGGAPAAWPPYTHAPPPYHHPGHAPYPMYGYPPHPHAAAYSHMPPPYGYYSGHPPPPGYPPMPAYHMPPPYMPPYGMPPQYAYGAYHEPAPAAAPQQPAGQAQCPARQPQPHHPPHHHHHHHHQAQRQYTSPTPQVRTPGARVPAASGGAAAPRPLQLMELPPVPCGLMAGGMESLSHSDLDGLSGLSELGQQAAKEAAAAAQGDDEAASPDRHRQGRHAGAHGQSRQDKGQGEGQGHGQAQQGMAAGAAAAPPPQLPQRQQQQPMEVIASGAGEEPVTLIRREARGSCPGDKIIASPSDGGATDGVASLYYQTPKTMTGKPDFKDVKARPMTIHVLQEEMVVMPLAGLGVGGEVGELHSPTNSLNLLENLGQEDGMEVAGMWGPVA